MKGDVRCLLGQTADNTHDHQQRRQRSQYQVQCHLKRLLSCRFLNLTILYHDAAQM